MRAVEAENVRAGLGVAMGDRRVRIKQANALSQLYPISSHRNFKVLFTILKHLLTILLSKMINLIELSFIWFDLKHLFILMTLAMTND